MILCSHQRHFSTEDKSLRSMKSQCFLNHQLNLKKGTLLHLDDGEVVALGFSYVRNIVLELEAWQVVIDVL